jgi:hypothetical protein
MTLSYLKAGRLKQWLGRPDSPAFLRECKALFDKAFGERSDNLPAASAFGPVPDHLKAVIRGTRIALRATHIMNGVVYSRSLTHIGNSLVVFYPGGNQSSCSVPGSIQYIVFYPNHDVVFVVQRQVAASPRQLDPFADYPHFPARMYSNSLSPKLEIVQPDWVVSHYARWALDNDLAVVLTLSQVCSSPCCSPVSDWFDTRIDFPQKSPDLEVAIGRWVGNEFLGTLFFKF